MLRTGALAIAVVILLSLAAACSQDPVDARVAFDPRSGLAGVLAERHKLGKAWDDLDAVYQEAERLASVSRPTAAERGRIRDLQTRLPVAEARFQVAYDDDQAALTAFLAAALAAQPTSEETRAALALNAESAVRYAGDLIARSGDYRRAIELLRTARGYFADARQPTPLALAKALRHASEFEVVTRAHFSRLSRGMTAAEARAQVGVPYAGNVRRSQVLGREVTSWLYRNDEGGATALYFDESGELYAWRWNVMSE
jgi:hypothetical protein